MNPIRSLPLPPGVSGRLYLHSMPGRNEPFPGFVAAAKALGIDTVYSLASIEEVMEKSHEYGAAIAAGAFPFAHLSFPVTDYGVPDNLEEFRRFISQTARQLEAGCTGLLHCGAGLGRTGMVAHCILVELGMSSAEATVAVRNAGSGAETPGQKRLVSNFRKSKPV